MRKWVFFVFLLLVIPHPASMEETYDISVHGTNYDEFYSPILGSIQRSSGGIATLWGSSNDLYLGINQGMALVTFIKLFDLYQEQKFIDAALKISDFVPSYLVDQRYGLVSSYYDAGEDQMSIYRNFADNLLMIWGLKELANRLNYSDSIEFNTNLGETRNTEVLEQVNRITYLEKDLDSFVLTDRFIGSYRIDNPSVPSMFNTFDNLFASYLITQTDEFSSILPTVENVFSFVKDNVRTSKGGVLSIYKSGYTDKTVSLRNTALFAILGLNLYQLTGTQSYLDTAIATMDYINTYFIDIGLTGGYLEALEDEKPIQQSKSLFSHAILLQVLVKLANLGNKDAKTQLLALSKTITQHFKYQYYSDTDYYDQVTEVRSIFYSSINRDGKPTSSSITIFDNLIMLYALADMPLLTNVEMFSEVDFSDRVKLSLSVMIPDDINSKIKVYFDDELVETKEMVGDGSVQHLTLELTPPRPDSDYEQVQLRVEIETEDLVTDVIESEFKVRKDTGIVLSAEVITILSVILIVVFVYFLKNISVQFVPEN
ncbi:MAG: AGE family epimerase/isomerase [Candidatus Heimdallarchaeota archaeon]|nr:AGE family epimerase/isomerase [Candidatus Heimdallarchaeota archaeon]